MSHDTSSTRAAHEAADTINQARAICAAATMGIDAASGYGTAPDAREIEGMGYILSHVCDLLDHASDLLVTARGEGGEAL